MKIYLNLTINLLIILVVLNLSTINISQASSTPIQQVLVTDKPYSSYNFYEFPINNFFQYYKKYENVTLLQATWAEINFLKSTNEEKSKLKFQIMECYKENLCNTGNTIEFPDNVEKEIVKEIFDRNVSFPTQQKYVYLVIFHRHKLKSTNNFNKENFKYMVFQKQVELDMWLSYIKHHDSNKKLFDMNNFIFEIKNESGKCLKTNNPFCMIRNNDENEIKNLFNSNNILASNSSLLLEFAYVTGNNYMALLLSELKVHSINFPTLKSKLYATAFYDLDGVIDYLIKNNLNVDFDEIYDNGLTLLGVAVANNSKKVIQFLIENGSKKLGKYLYFDYYALDKDGKVVNHNLDFLLKQLVNKYENDDLIPELLQSLAYSQANYHMWVDKNINWLKQFSIDNHGLFNKIFLKNNKYSRELLLNSIYSSTEENFDSLIALGFDLCLTFDNSARNQLDINKISNQDSWLGKSWIKDKYKLYIEQCH